MNAVLVFALAVLLSACAAEPPTVPGALTPEQVVNLAAQSAPRQVHVLVAMRVTTVSMGIEYPAAFLHSEMDRRDVRNVTIEIPPQSLPALEAKFGGPLKKTLWGKRVRVEGPAIRLTAWNRDSAGNRIGGVAYQTHILVSKPSQIDLL
jgi:hypothetical protein